MHEAEKVEVSAWVVVADLGPEQKRVDVALFFDEAHAGQYLHDTKLHELGGGIDVQPRKLTVGELHSAHQAVFLCQNCVDGIGRPDRHKDPARPKNHACVYCQVASLKKRSAKG